MTENQWPQTTPAASAGGHHVDTASTKDAVKDEASAVAGHAAGEAKNVAGTAKAEAANVATEAKSNALDLLHQAKSDLTDQAGTQQQKAAEGIHAISSQLNTMADASEEPGVAADLVRQAADRTRSVATWLENRDPGSVMEDVKSFARQRPGTFLMIAAGAGILAGRLGRSLQAGAPDVQRSPSASPRLTASAAVPAHQETVIVAGSGDRFFDEPVLPGTAGPVSTQKLPSGTSADTALRDEVPFPNREGGQL
ncbi:MULTISPECIES: hypothetical protein [unclassified Arthrobacter]|uniref:hypothetical protein n=1 Tax=unclassified Arthrobacter TaxID=235627 RepID=UPI002E031812|nr:MULTISPECIES: hypothetical protein [unclassified Arthrobacter]MEC5191511.1 ElaB/YqjD/DUF883 family membrane-anchored ribosome-binding protein [Arthrobacter sp. MP_M4]MEC5203094.1 ElaB/YqjD/DUF883 family membrane-anchored ribosome-binding protein [Arthrobacter sp. MP_M7]